MKMTPDGYFFNCEKETLAHTMHFTRELPTSGVDEEFTRSPEVQVINIIFVVIFAVFISWLARKLADRGRRGKK